MTTTETHDTWRTFVDGLSDEVRTWLMANARHGGPMSEEQYNQLATVSAQGTEWVFVGSDSEATRTMSPKFRDFLINHYGDGQQPD